MSRHSRRWYLGLIVIAAVCWLGLNGHLSHLRQDATLTSSHSGPGPVSAPAGPGEAAWVRSFLRAMNVSPANRTQADIASMEDWIRHETPWPPVAAYNPMNTTLRMPGSTTYNSVGVQNYVNVSQGIAANAETLIHYPAITAALRSGSGICGGSFSGEFGTWSGNGYYSVC